MQELSERTLWIITITVVAAVMTLSLAAIRYSPELHGNQKNGTTEAITSVENELDVQSRQHDSHHMSDAFFHAEQKMISDEETTLQQEL